MEVIAKESLEQIRLEMAKRYNMPLAENVRCLYCNAWGWNNGKAMNDLGESICKHRKWPNNKTASYQWCKKFERF